MRTELEFSIKFIIDPTEPVSPNQVKAMAGMYDVLRSLQKTPEQLAALGAVLERYQPLVTPRTQMAGNLPAKARNDIWRERQQVAETAIEQHAGDLFAAARALGISTYALNRWRYGPASSRVVPTR